MGAIVNGMALSDLRAYGATFLIFSDYMKPAVRSRRCHGAAGHLGLHPRLHRPGRRRADAPADRTAGALAGDAQHDRHPPCDANEVGEAWRVAMEQKTTPVCLVLTRQSADLRPQQSTLRPTRSRAAATSWPIRPDDKAGCHPDRHRQRSAALHAGAREADERRHRRTRGLHAVLGTVRAQDEAYRDRAAAAVTARVSVEAGATLGWERYVGTERRDDRHAQLRRVGPAPGC